MYGIFGCLIASLLIVLAYALVLGVIALGYWLICLVCGWTFDFLVVLAIFCIGLFLKWIISSASSSN